MVSLEAPFALRFSFNAAAATAAAKASEGAESGGAGGGEEESDEPPKVSLMVIPRFLMILV